MVLRVVFFNCHFKWGIYFKSYMAQLIYLAFMYMYKRLYGLNLSNKSPLNKYTVDTL